MQDLLCVSQIQMETVSHSSTYGGFLGAGCHFLKQDLESNTTFFISAVSHPVIDAIDFGAFPPHVTAIFFAQSRDSHPIGSGFGYDASC